MAGSVRGLCSMATANLLAELSNVVDDRLAVRFTACGGVDVARHIRAGSDADLVVLADEALRNLDRDDFLLDGTLRTMFASDVVAAVRSDITPPPMTTEGELRESLRNAGRIGVSTGPSGTTVLQLIDKWGLVPAVGHKLIRPEPGTPVASLLIAGTVDLAFQQRSELTGIDGIRVIGTPPGTVLPRSIFSGAVLARSQEPALARSALDLLSSPDVARYVERAGMTLAPV